MLPARAAGGGDAPPALRAPTHDTVPAAAPKMMLSGHSITAGPPGAGPGGPNPARHLGTNTPCKPSRVLMACTELCQKKKDFLEVQSCPALHQHPQFAEATGMGSYLDGGAGGDDARVVHGVAVVDVIGGRAFLRLGRHGDGDQARPGGEVHVGAVAKGLDGVSWGGRRKHLRGGRGNGVLATMGRGRRTMGERLTEAGVLREVPEELLALLLQVAAAFAGAPGRDGDAGGAGVHVVGRHVEACTQERKRRRDEGLRMGYGWGEPSSPCPI